MVVGGDAFEVGGDDRLSRDFAAEIGGRHARDGGLFDWIGRGGGSGVPPDDGGESGDGVAKWVQYTTVGFT